MRPFACFMAAGMLAFAAFSAHAATVAYGEAFDTLYRIDLDARTATTIGAAGSYGGASLGNVTGLTSSADGSLFAVVGSYKLLLQLNATNGGANVIGNLGLADSGVGQFGALDLGMAASCDGRLWLSSAIVKKLWTVDPQSGEATLVGSTVPAISGLAFREGTLYGAAGKDDNTLYTVDTASGNTTAIGHFGTDIHRWVNSVSMAFDAHGVLWAVLNYVPPQHDTDAQAEWADLATIDPATGIVTVLGPITGPESLRYAGMKGFTLGTLQCSAAASAPIGAPVNTPWALVLLGLLLGMAAWHSQRRLVRA